MVGYNWIRYNYIYIKMDKITHIINDTISTSNIDIEDGGRYFGILLCDNSEEENGMYVKICSWDENRKHTDFNKFKNRKIKITIETID